MPISGPHARRCRNALILLLTAGAVAVAAAADATTDAMQLAYAPYRAALFATNQKSQPDAAKAVSASAAAWDQLVGRLRASPTVPYDRDSALGDTLQRVQGAFATADRQVAAGQLPEAHETLEAVRDLLADLRQRNGVVVYSDHMNAYHEQMEQVLQEGPRLLQQPDSWMTLAARAGVLDYLAQRLRSQAPAALAKQAEFDQLLTDVLQATGQFGRAVQRQDGSSAREALGKLKGPYSRLFLKFG